MGNPHGLLIVAGPDSLRLGGGRQSRARGFTLQILYRKLADTRQSASASETWFGVNWPDCRGKPRQMGRQTYREGNKADMEAGTLRDSEWVSRRRARLLLAESAELCD